MYEKTDNEKILYYWKLQQHLLLGDGEITKYVVKLPVRSAKEFILQLFITCLGRYTFVITELWKALKISPAVFVFHQGGLIANDYTYGNILRYWSSLKATREKLLPQSCSIIKKISMAFVLWKLCEVDFKPSRPSLVISTATNKKIMYWKFLYVNQLVQLLVLERFQKKFDHAYFIMTAEFTPVNCAYNAIFEKRGYQGILLLRSTDFEVYSEEIVNSLALKLRACIGISADCRSYAPPGVRLFTIKPKIGKFRDDGINSFAVYLSAYYDLKDIDLQRFLPVLFQRLAHVLKPVTLRVEVFSHPNDQRPEFMLPYKVNQVEFFSGKRKECRFDCEFAVVGNSSVTDALLSTCKAVFYDNMIDSLPKDYLGYLRKGRIIDISEIEFIDHSFIKNVTTARLKNPG